MAWNFLASQIASSSPGAAATTAAISTTGADLIVVAIAYLPADLPALTDSQSNTWTALTGISNTGRVQLFYCASPSTNASHTFTSGAQTFGKVIAVAAYSGMAGSPFDVQNGSTTDTPGNVTNTGGGQLLVAACQDAGGTGAVISVLTNCVGANLQKAPVVGGTHFALGLVHAYAVNGAGGSTGLQFLSSSSPSSVIASFKIAASGGSSGGSYGFA